MKKGEFADGEKVLRAKIDMAHPNMLFRDPIMYRILHAEHHRTGNKWCIYPMYDYAHGQCDSIERITHSICTLEFDVHRPLYDWFIQALDIYPSHQYEFARLNLTYTMMSKRRLLKLVQEGAVMGWDDPRMPTICALRRKGYTPASVRNFAEMVGVAKRDNVIDLGKLEFCVREDLNKVAERRMAVLNPLKVVITNYPEGKTELFTAINNPEDENAGTRQVPFSTRDLYRTRRLHGGPAQEILPPESRYGGAPALLLPDPMRRGRQGCRRQHHGASLHVRPGVGQRFVERRPPRERRDPLGIGGRCDRSRNPALQPAFHDRRSRRRGRRRQLGGQSQPRFDDQSPEAIWNRRLGRLPSGSRSSSSA